MEELAVFYLLDGRQPVPSAGRPELNSSSKAANYCKSAKK